MSGYGGGIYGVSSYGGAPLFLPVGPSGSGGDWVSTPRLLRVTIDGVVLEDVTDWLVDGYIDWDEDRTSIPMGGSVTLRGGRVRAYDFLMPSLTLDREDGTHYELPLGHLTVDLPSGFSPINGGTQTFGLKDLTAVLASSVTRKTTSLADGLNVGLGLGSVCAEAGVTRYTFPKTSQTLDHAVSYPNNTTRLRKANDLALAGSFVNVYPRMDGRLTTQHPKSIAASQPSGTLGKFDLLMDPTGQPDQAGFGNVVAVTRNVPGGDPVTIVRRNTDPKSAASVERLNGREIPLPDITIPDGMGDAAMEDAAADALQKGASYLHLIRTKIVASPILAPRRVIDFDYVTADRDLSGRCRLKAFRIPFAPNQAVADVTLARYTEPDRDEDEP